MDVKFNHSTHSQRTVLSNNILNAFQAMLEEEKLTIQTVKHRDSVNIAFKDT